MGPRKLIKEGVVLKHKSGRKLCMFLCNDMIILTDEGVNRLYKMVSVTIIVAQVEHDQLTHDL